MVHARVEPGQRDGRHRGRTRLLLAGDDRRLAAGAAAGGVTAALTWVNVRGIRQSAWLVNALTIGKLLPLALFILLGLRYVDLGAVTTLPPITLRQFSTAALLMIFVYGGYDVVPVPAGEALDPRRHVPFALVATILTVMTVMTLAQIVAQSVLPDLADHSTPIADAAAVFLGAGGALLVGVGSVVSMTGNNAGQILSGSRMLFALAEHGELPRDLRPRSIRDSARRPTPSSSRRWSRWSLR